MMFAAIERTDAPGASAVRQLEIAVSGSVCRRYLAGAVCEGNTNQDATETRFPRVSPGGGAAGVSGRMHGADDACQTDNLSGPQASLTNITTPQLSSRHEER